MLFLCVSGCEFEPDIAVMAGPWIPAALLGVRSDETFGRGRLFIVELSVTDWQGLLKVNVLNGRAWGGVWWHWTGLDVCDQ